MWMFWIESLLPQASARPTSVVKEGWMISAKDSELADIR